MDTFLTAYLTCKLDGEEQFKFDTPTGRIMVDEVSYWIDSKKASLRGWAINADGRSGLIRRTGSMEPADLPIEVRRQFKTLMERVPSTTFLEVED